MLSGNDKTLDYKYPVKENLEKAIFADDIPGIWRTISKVTITKVNPT